MSTCIAEPEPIASAPAMSSSIAPVHAVARTTTHEKATALASLDRTRRGVAPVMPGAYARQHTVGRDLRWSPALPALPHPGITSAALALHFRRALHFPPAPR